MLRIAWVYVAVTFLPWPALCGAAAALGTLRGGRRLGVALGWLPAAALAAALAVRDRPAAPPELPVDGLIVCATLWVDERPVHGEGRSTAWARVESLAGCDSLVGDAIAGDWRGRRVRVSARDVLPAYGGRCRVRGRLRPPRPPRNFAAFDEKRFVASRGVVAILEVDSHRSLAGDRGSTWRRRYSEPSREWVRVRLHDVLAAREAALLTALILGIRDMLDARLEEGWRALGMSHVLALSGLHVGLVAGAILWLARTPRRRAGWVVLSSGVVAYTALGGFGPSVVRAATMAVWMATAVHIGRRGNPRTALVCAVLLLTLDAPERVLDLRFQLSGLATLGILLWLPALTRLTRNTDDGRVRQLMRRGLAVCGVGLAAQAATFPLIVKHFGFVSWVSPLANLTLVPLVGLALVVALAGLPALCISDALGRALWLLAAATLHGVLRITDVFPEGFEPRLFVATTPLDIAAAWLVSIASLFGGLAVAKRWWRTTRVALVTACLSGALLGSGALRGPPPAWELVALDVGQGDALLVRVGTRTWLIDAGDDRPVDAGERTIVPYLRRNGIDRLHGLVLSHPHRDHYGGAPSVLAAVAVDTVYVARASSSAAAYAPLRAAAPQVPWRGLVAGQRLSLAPSFDVDVLWPRAIDTLQSGANGVSLVLWGRGKGMPDLLAMGDLEADGEELLLAAAGPALVERAKACLVLKVGHHGSRTSSTVALLDAAHADLAVISAGRRNRFGHPAEETLLALRARGCTVLRTDRGGAVRLLRRGETLWLERPSRAPRPLRFEMDVF